MDEPEAFASGRGHPIEPDSRRRAIDRHEWLEAHRAAGALGFTAANVASGSADAHTYPKKRG